ncbi:MAG: aldo/keto reductase [Mycobacteriales bacterium]
MRYRLLGQGGLRVSELFLGAMTFGGTGVPPAECRRILDVYAEAGGNVVDTAVNYRGGASEEVLGELLAGDRDRWVVATKYSVTRDGADPNAAGNHRKNLALSLETSLRRLRTDYVDLYWVHLWDRHTPIEETLRALDDAVRAGKVLYVGIADCPAWVAARANTLAEWRGWSPFVAVQWPYSLLSRDIEREILPMAESSGMAVAAFATVASGILAGTFTRPGGPPPGTRVPPDSLTPHDLAVARAVDSEAAELGVPSARVAIAWTRHRSRAVHPILGARTAGQLADNLGAVDLVLPAETVARLDRASGFVPGYPADFVDPTAPWPFGEASLRVDGRG